MKTILTLTMIVLIAGTLLAKDELAITGDMTITELAFKMRMPVKKLLQELELPADTPLTATVDELNIDKTQLADVRDTFNKDLIGFCSSITAVGMMVVFLSLIVTGAIISQIKRLNNSGKKQKKASTSTVETSIGKVTGPEPDVSTNAIIAVITALHLHISEAEERQKLLLTWKRAPLSLWRGSSRSAMPNQTYFQAKGRS